MSMNSQNLIIVVAFLVAVAVVVDLGWNPKEPSITSPPNGSDVVTTAIHSRDSSLMMSLNGTFSGQISAPASISKEVREYLEMANATLYSFKVEVVQDNGTPRASVTLYLLRIVPPFKPGGFKVFIDAKPVFNGTYVPVYPNVPITIEYHGEEYPGRLTVNPQSKTLAKFTVEKSHLDRHPGETIKLGTLKLRGDGNFTILVRVERAGNYTLIVEGSNGEELVTGGLVVG